MNRFAVDGDKDRSAPIWIATMLAIIYSLIALIGRTFLKAASIGTEDAVIVGAQVVAFGQIGATIYAIKQGVGLTDVSLLNSDKRTGVIRSFKASQILYLVATAIRPCVSVLGGIVAVWGIGSSLATSTSCQPVHVMEGQNSKTCPGGGARWLAVLVIECLLEGAIVALPTMFCAKLQMSTGKKAKVVVAFAFRLLIILFSAMHYSAYQAVISSNSNTYLSSVVIWQQAGLCYSLISATIPVSLQFIGRFATGVSVALSTLQSLSPQGTHRSRQYGASLTRRKSKTSAMRSEDEQILTIMSDEVGNFSSACRALRRQISHDGIIRQDIVTLTYTQPGQAY